AVQGLSIAKNTTPQEVVGFLADRADALEFELEIDAVAGLAGRVAHVLPQEDAPGEAAVVVLDAEQAFERVVVAQRVVPAADRAPALVQRDERRDVGLVEEVAAVAVAEIDEPGLAEAVLQAARRQVGAVAVRIPLVGELEAPAVRKMHVEFRDV